MCSVWFGIRFNTCFIKWIREYFLPFCFLDEIMHQVWALHPRFLLAIFVIASAPSLPCPLQAPAISTVRQTICLSSFLPILGIILYSTVISIWHHLPFFCLAQNILGLKSRVFSRSPESFSTLFWNLPSRTPCRARAGSYWLTGTSAQTSRNFVSWFLETVTIYIILQLNDLKTKVQNTQNFCHFPDYFLQCPVPISWGYFRLFYLPGRNTAERWANAHLADFTVSDVTSVTWSWSQWELFYRWTWKFSQIQSWMYCFVDHLDSRKWWQNVTSVD